MHSDYCERTGAGLWAEPFNAVSNVAFLITCALLLWLVWRTRRAAPGRGADLAAPGRGADLAAPGRGAEPPASVWLLPVLLGVVGLCSLSFHTFANPFTEALDSLSILAFVLVGLTVIVHWMWGVRWRLAWLAAPAFVVFAAVVDAPLIAFAGPTAALGGYLPALLGLIAVGVALRLRGDLARYGTWLLWDSVVLAVSLTARTVDRPLCTEIPIGTHFVWHCLNAVVLFVIGYAVWHRWSTLRAGDHQTGLVGGDHGLGTVA